MLSSDIKVLKSVGAPPHPLSGGQLSTTLRYPFLYQKITKCGCTFLQNLLFYLDHDEELYFPDGEKNPKFEKHQRANSYKIPDIRKNAYKFVVIRNPVYRFMSLYFDKMVGPEGVKLQSMAYRFQEEAGTELHPGTDIERHRINVHKALDYVEKELSEWPHRNTNWHWKPQTVRMSQLREQNFTTMTLEGLNWQLPMLLNDLIPDFETKMNAARYKNKSVKPLPVDDVLNWKLRKRLRNIYADDFKMYSAVRAYWKDKTPEHLS